MPELDHPRRYDQAGSVRPDYHGAVVVREGSTTFSSSLYRDVLGYGDHELESRRASPPRPRSRSWGRARRVWSILAPVLSTASATLS